MSLELKRKQLERARVLMARDEMEFQILELDVQVKRIRENILNQEKRAQELEALIQQEQEKQEK